MKSTVRFIPLVLALGAGVLMLPGLTREDEVDAEVRSLPFKHELWRFDIHEPIREITLGGHFMYIETENHELIAMDRRSGVTQWRWRIPTGAPLDFPPVEVQEDLEGYMKFSAQAIEKFEEEIVQLDRQIDLEMNRTAPDVDKLRQAQGEFDKKMKEFEDKKADLGSEHPDVMALRTQLEEMTTNINQLRHLRSPDMKTIEGLRDKRRQAGAKREGALLNDNVYCLSKTVLYCLTRLPQPRAVPQQVWTKRFANFVPSARPFASRSYVYIPAVDLDRVWAIEVNPVPPRTTPGYEYGYYRSGPIVNSPTQSGDLKPIHDVVTQPMYIGDHLYFASRSGLVYRYDDKQRISSPWPVDVRCDIIAAPLIHTRHLDIVQDDAATRTKSYVIKFLFVGGLDGAFHAYDADSGGKLWKFETGGVIKDAPVAREDTVYVKTEKGYLFALNLWPMVKDKSGKTMWEILPSKDRAWGPNRFGEIRWKIPMGERFLVKGQERVYVLGPNRQIFSMDEMSGTEKGRTLIENLDFLITNPLDDIFYVATKGGRLYALKESKGQY